MLDADVLGPTRVDLRWEKPSLMNGILTGYNISYETSEL